MKKYLTPFILCTMVLISACSNATDSSKNVEKASSEEVVKTVSLEDQKIIDKYESYFKYYREGNFEEFQSKMKEVLPEVSKISDKKKREFMQMNIYMTLQNYKDAYALNEKQLKEKPNDTARLTFRCQLLTLQKKEATLINKCYDNLADVLKVELDKPENKSNPDYKIGEFSYLLAKYKAGHIEYKQKMQEYLAETKDEKLKASLTSLYDMEFEN
ncbi:hypothetical protein [Acinetobacter baumannii]|uniref:hypothetical protein n=1 Tax=Acinetobacter baumannii TaxID=470 RepID=UPI000B8D15FC|nr:hypothetical protein [Acinetobacter baumannii]MCJ9007437.1 hypothetical protein [Acinetobacter baumannii]MCJ9366748.1 hypothetical protein [Acinetobacter baumannii]MCJ9400276.1 hypothetical protein [Acinetobacter baumannii]MCJ9462005.1 hypothetical protein [Acinetobacter baumannii]MDP7720249.1 hypothetical protein [Acinetobacter baumannii]